MPPDDPTRWSKEDVAAFVADAAPERIEAVAKRLGSNGDARALEVLRHFLFESDAPLWYEQVPAVAAARALLEAGDAGVRILRDAMTSRATPTKTPALLMLLWHARRGEPPVDALWQISGLPAPAPLSPHGQAAADAVLRDFMAEALIRTDLFISIGVWLQQIALTPGTGTEEVASDAIGCLGKRRSS
jgi:hypothetical protein